MEKKVSEIITKQIFKEYPFLISVIANLDLEVETGEIEGGRVESLTTRTSDLFDEKVKMIITLNPKNKFDEKLVKHIVLHELMHILDRHYMFGTIKKILNDKVNNELLTIAAEYTVARLLQIYFDVNELTEYENAYIKLGEKINPDLASLRNDEINIISVYRLLEKNENQYQQMKQQMQQLMQQHDSVSDNYNDNQNNGNGNNNQQNKQSSNKGNNKQQNSNKNNNNGNNNQSNKNSNDSNNDNLNNDKNNNEDSSNKQTEVSKLAGSQRGNDNYETLELEKEFISYNQSLLKLITNQNIFKVEPKVVDPIADLKSKILSELKLLNTYDYYMHDFITHPDFTYFIPQQKTRTKNEKLTCIIDVSGSLTSYVRELIKFIMQFKKLIDYIILHDVEIVQVINTKEIINNDDLKFNITGGGTSFIDAYNFVINNKLTNNKIIHITDLYTDHNDFELIKQFKKIKYFVKYDDCDQSAVSYIEQKFKNAEIIYYEAIKDNKVPKQKLTV